MLGVSLMIMFVGWLGEPVPLIFGQIIGWGWGVGGGGWVWRRRLLAWKEDSVMECSSLLSNVVLQDASLDRWRWILDPTSGYTVKGTYQYFTKSDTLLETGLFYAAWLKYVPLKVSIFVWRLLRNRLPTKDNLLCRRIPYHDDIICAGGCGCPETTCHLLFRCNFYGGLWHLIYQWIDIDFTPPESVREHLHQFGNMAGLSRFTHSFLKAIWHAGCWVVWKERNTIIFSHTAKDLANLLESVKFLSFA